MRHAVPRIRKSWPKRWSEKERISDLRTTATGTGSSRRLPRAYAAGIVCLLLAAILPGCSGGRNNSLPSGGGTTPGNYTITVNAYTVSNNGTKPDASVTIPLTVN
jgi:hypothetical protein